CTTNSLLEEIKSLAKITDRILPVSANLVSIMQNLKISGRYEVVENTADENIFYSSQQISKEEEFTFLHISNFDKRFKNVEGIINAFARFSKNNSKTQLCIAGDGDIKELE